MHKKDQMTVQNKSKLKISNYSVNNSFANTGDEGFIPEPGRSPEVANCNPLQYSSLENSMERGAWKSAVHEITNSWM